MRIASITIEGTTEGTNTLPRAFVEIGRKRGDKHIYAEILQPNKSGRTMTIEAGGSPVAVANRTGAAVEIAGIMRGMPGTNSEVHEILRMLRRFAD